MKKADVLSILNTMEDDIDIERFIYTLYLKHKLALAEEDIRAGRLLTQEEVEEEARSWLA